MGCRLDHTGACGGQRSCNLVDLMQQCSQAQYMGPCPAFPVVLNLSYSVAAAQGVKAVHSSSCSICPHKVLQGRGTKDD